MWSVFCLHVALNAQCVGLADMYKSGIVSVEQKLVDFFFLFLFLFRLSFMIEMACFMCSLENTSAESVFFLYIIFLYLNGIWWFYGQLSLPKPFEYAILYILFSVKCSLAEKSASAVMEALPQMSLRFIVITVDINYVVMVMMCGNFTFQCSGKGIETSSKCLNDISGCDGR